MHVHVLTCLQKQLQAISSVFRSSSYILPKAISCLGFTVEYFSPFHLSRSVLPILLLNILLLGVSSPHCHCVFWQIIELHFLPVCNVASLGCCEEQNALQV